MIKFGLKPFHKFFKRIHNIKRYWQFVPFVFLSVSPIYTHFIGHYYPINKKLNIPFEHFQFHKFQPRRNSNLRGISHPQAYSVINHGRYLLL